MATSTGTIKDLPSLKRWVDEELSVLHPPTRLAKVRLLCELERMIHLRISFEQIVVKIKVGVLGIKARFFEQWSTYQEKQSTVARAMKAWDDTFPQTSSTKEIAKVEYGTEGRTLDTEGVPLRHSMEATIKALRVAGFVFDRVMDAVHEIPGAQWLVNEVRKVTPDCVRTFIRQIHEFNVKVADDLNCTYGIPRQMAFSAVVDFENLYSPFLISAVAKVLRLIPKRMPKCPAPPRQLLLAPAEPFAFTLPYKQQRYQERVMQICRRAPSSLERIAIKEKIFHEIDTALKEFSTDFNFMQYIKSRLPGYKHIKRVEKNTSIHIFRNGEHSISFVEKKEYAMTAAKHLQIFRELDLKKTQFPRIFYVDPVEDIFFMEFLPGVCLDRELNFVSRIKNFDFRKQEVARLGGVLREFGESLAEMHSKERGRHPISPNTTKNQVWGLLHHYHASTIPISHKNVDAIITHFLREGNYASFVCEDLGFHNTLYKEGLPFASIDPSCDIESHVLDSTARPTTNALSFFHDKIMSEIDNGGFLRGERVFLKESLVAGYSAAFEGGIPHANDRFFRLAHLCEIDDDFLSGNPAFRAELVREENFSCQSVSLEPGEPYGPLVFRHFFYNESETLIMLYCRKDGRGNLFVQPYVEGNNECLVSSLEKLAQEEGAASLNVLLSKPSPFLKERASLVEQEFPDIRGPSDAFSIDLLFNDASPKLLFRFQI